MYKTGSLLVSGILAASVNAQASTYVTLEAGQAQANIGTSHFEAFNQSVVNSGGTARLSTDKQSTAFILGVGYEYSPHFALEAQYLNLGQVSATSTTSDTNSSGITRQRQISESAEQSGIALNAIGQYALHTDWMLKGSLGLAWLSQKAKGNATGQSVNAAGTVVANESSHSSRTRQEWAPVIGLGMSYQMAPKWQLQLNWRRVLDLEPSVLGKYSVDALSLGTLYRF